MHDKRYIVKVYKAGIFQGVLPYVVADFSYTQEINTAGCAIDIKLATTLKGSGVGVDVDYLVTQADNHIVDQNGNRLITRRDYIFSNVPLDLGNTIEVWLYYSGAPNGKRVFSGLASKWQADESGATITLTALSFGVQLDNYLIKVLPGADLLRYPTSNTSDSIYPYDQNNTQNRSVAAAQTFTVPTNTTISAVALGLHKPLGNPTSYTASVYLCNGAPDTGLGIMAFSSALVTQTTSHALSFELNQSVAVTAGATYTILVTTTGPASYGMLIDRDTSGTYANGFAWLQNDTTQAWSKPGGSFSFSVTASSTTIGNQFLSQDPSYMLTSMLDSIYNSGGQITYDATTIDNTNSIVSYTFKYDTVLDGVKKCVELAPAKWYWYVDVGTNFLHFHQFKLVPDFYFTKGDEINDLAPTYSLENMKNSVILTGGENPATPGINIVSQQANTSSIGRYGQWLDMESDSRVTRQDTADIMTNNAVGEYAQPIFSATATVLATRFDIEQLHIGQMIGFHNFNDLTNSLVLQIASISRTPDKADLKLATLPPTQAHRIEDIKRDLDNLVTADNPTQ